jgi:hypothetical protein
LLLLNAFSLVPPKAFCLGHTSIFVQFSQQIK